jgi:hypothetical protein
MSDPEFSECAKGLDFPAGVSGDQNQKSLAGVQFKRNDIELIEGSQWSPADPEQGIAEGKPIESAVREGFSHSLISFSQVAFSGNRKDALVKFGAVCGRLCGSGSTIRLQKSAGHWTILKRCGDWIS